MTHEEKAAGRRFVAAHIGKMRPAGQGFFGTLFASPAFTGALLAAVLGIGVARGAENALPGDALFPLKAAGETALGSLMVSAETKAAWEARLARKRLDEIKTLSDEKRLTASAAKAAKENLSAHIAKAQAHIAALAAEDGSSPRAAEIHSKIESALAAYGKILDWAGAGDMAKIITAEAEETSAARAKTERAAVERGGSDGKSARKRIERNLEKTEKAIEKAKPHAEGNAPATRATAEAQRILEGAARDAAESRVKLEAGSYGDAFLLGQESQRQTDEAAIIVEVGAHGGPKLPDPLPPAVPDVPVPHGLSL